MQAPFPTSALALAGEMLNDMALIASGLLLLFLSWAGRCLADRYEAMLKEQERMREDIERLEWNARLSPIQRNS